MTDPPSREYSSASKGELHDEHEAPSCSSTDSLLRGVEYCDHE